MPATKTPPKVLYDYSILYKRWNKKTYIYDNNKQTETCSKANIAQGKWPKTKPNKTPTKTTHLFLLPWLVWLKLFNAGLSPKRYCWGPRSLELGDEGDYTNRYTVTIRIRVQELCESRGGRPGLPSLISLRFMWTLSNTSTNHQNDSCIKMGKEGERKNGLLVFCLVWFGVISPYLFLIMTCAMFVLLHVSVCLLLM